MAKVFLDANIVIDLIEKRRVPDQNLLDHDLFLSPLSFHILTYTYKYRMPHVALIKSRRLFNIVPLDEFINDSALNGPTADFEDNVQLHSAANADCDFFLTNDKQILNMKFFGKTRIIKDFANY